MSYPETEHELARAQASRAELIERMSRLVTADGAIEAQKGLYLFRASAATECIHSVFKPAFCIIAQGSKEIMLGEDRYRYDPWHYLLGSVELPVASQIIEASKERPYLGLRIILEPALVTSVMLEADIASMPGDANVKAMAVSRLDASLLDAVVRLIRLLETANDFQILAPLVMREIVYRLLTGELGGRLRYITASGGNTPRMAKAIELLRENFDKPLRIENIAQEMKMSVSGFHHHFKAVTAMSPLQFQKQLRLQEARRLMLAEDVDAANAGFRVGYDDASHFSREYKRLFGAPPQRDIMSLRQLANK
jgi:AraC-like DNA-binding protein